MANLSFTTMGTPELDGPTSIKLARQCGFDGIDLRVSNNKGEVGTPPLPGQVEEICKTLDGEGVELVSIFSYNERGTDDPSSWQVMEDSLLEHMDIAHQLKCPAVRMFGGDPQQAKGAEDYIKRTADVVSNVLQRHDSEIEIRLQNHKGSFLFMQGRQLHQLVNSPRFSQAFSPDHCYLMGEDFEEILPIAKETSGQIFISDLVLADNEKGCIRTEIGQGDVPLLEAIQCLGQDFSGYWTLKWEKIWNPYLAEPEDAFPRFMDWLEKEGLKEK